MTGRALVTVPRPQELELPAGRGAAARRRKAVRIATITVLNPRTAGALAVATELGLPLTARYLRGQLQVFLPPEAPR